MSTTPKLTIELVPRTAWFKNLRSMIGNQWDEMRKECYKKADYCCEICGGTGPKWPVECHEIWEYDDEKHVQKLIGLIALCPDCHMVKHIGLAKKQGKINKAIRHMQRVNNMLYSECEQDVKGAMIEWVERSQHKWTIDIEWIKGDGACG